MNGIILLFSPTDNIVLWPLSCIFAKIFQIVLWHPYYYWKKIKVPLQNVKSSFEKIQLCLLTACILAWVYCSNFLPIIMKTPFNYCRLGRQCVTIYDDSIVPLWAKIGRNTKKKCRKAECGAECVQAVGSSLFFGRLCLKMLSFLHMCAFTMPYTIFQTTNCISGWDSW